MSPNNRFMFYNFMMPSSEVFKNVTGDNTFRYYLWNHIIHFNINEIMIERFINPKRLLQEIILILEELENQKRFNWNKEDLLKNLKHELISEINSSKYQFLEPLNAKLKILFKAFKEPKNKLDYLIFLVKDILNEYSVINEYEYWKSLLKTDFNKDQINIEQIYETTRNLLLSLLYNGYSIEFIEDLTRHSLFFDNLHFSEKLDKINFKVKDYIIHIIFRGFLRSEDERTIDVINYKDIFVYNPLSNNLPEIIKSEIKLRLDSTKFNNLIGFRIPVKSLDTHSAFEMGRKNVYDILNIFAWGASRLDEIEYIILGESGYNLHKRSQQNNPDNLFMRKKLLIHSIEELEKLSHIGHDSLRFKLYLRKIRQYRISDSIEEKIINLWVGLEALIGESGDRSIRNSKIIQFYCPKAYIISRCFWETENILQRLIYDSTEVKKLLNVLAEENGFPNYWGLRRMHLRLNYDKIKVLINSPCLKHYFDNFCKETNHELALKLERLEHNIRTELKLLTVVRNSLIHGFDLNMNYSILCEKLVVVSRSTSSILMKLLTNHKSSVNSCLLMIQQSFDILLMKLNEDDNFEVDNYFGFI